MISIVRISAISLGEMDVSPIKNIAKSYPDKEFVFYDEGNSIWHEIGIISVAIQRASSRVVSPERAAQALKNGKILVLSDGQKDSLLPILEKDTPGLRVYPWKRWKRGFAVPSFKDLMNLGRGGSKEWQEMSQKEYKILVLDQAPQELNEVH
jgi:hypothetical protein